MKLVGDGAPCEFGVAQRASREVQGELGEADASGDGEEDVERQERDGASSEQLAHKTTAIDLRKQFEFVPWLARKGEVHLDYGFELHGLPILNVRFVTPLLHAFGGRLN